MAKITKSYESDIDLTIFTVVGEITFDEVSDQTLAYFRRKPLKFALWDFTLGTVKRISSQEVDRIAKIDMADAARVEGRKGAIVTPKDLDYGLSRMFQAFSKFYKFPLEVEIFRDIDAAKNWLISG